MLQLLHVCIYVIIIKACVCVLQYGKTPLHEAASRGYVDILETLVTAGATVDATSNVSCSNNKV